MYDRSNDLLWPFVRTTVLILTIFIGLTILTVTMAVIHSKLWLVLSLIFAVPPTSFITWVIHHNIKNVTTTNPYDLDTTQ